MQDYVCTDGDSLSQRAKPLVPRMPSARLRHLNFRLQARTCSFTRRPHFQVLSTRIFLNLPPCSNDIQIIT